MDMTNIGRVRAETLLDHVSRFWTLDDCYRTSCRISLPDNPMTCKRLTEKERVVAIARLQGDTTGIENRTFKTAQVWELLLDSRAWMMRPAG